MAHTLLWPKKSFFYPIGNTTPCSMTQDIPPEQPANILLLGCGDPRNILFTVHSDSSALSRSLDFTCCDLEPAVLARNVILLTMIVDGEISYDRMWNVFYDFMVKKEVVDSLATHCQKLVQLSFDIDAWNKSYGFFLRMCTLRTMHELRRHWSLYAAFRDFPPEKRSRMKSAFMKGMQDVSVSHQDTVVSIARSAGPFAFDAIEPTSKHFSHFWGTGVHSMNPKNISGATSVNPTFVYSVMGDKFNVHYGTDGLAAFHLAPAFAALKPPAPVWKKSPTSQSLVECAQGQFKEWCQSFRASARSQTRSVVVRLFLGDVINFCRALHVHNSAHTSSTGLHTSPWSGSPLDLDGGDYITDTPHRAPAIFDAIDTSNLSDHLGLLNLLLVARPILSVRPYSSIYTEALLASGSDATSSIMDQIGGDLSTMSLLLDLTPSSYLTKFTTYSNRHEIMLHRAMGGSPQYHERTTWKTLTASDSLALIAGAGERELAATFEPRHLAHFLFGVYLKMFSNEDTLSMMRNASLEAIKKSNLIHYIRATFATFLKLVKQRAKTDWEVVMDQLLELIESDKTLMMGMNNYQDLCCQLHLLDVYSVGTLTPQFTNVAMGRPRGRLQGWKDIPPVVCLTLVVPRSSLKTIEDQDEEKIGTPPLQCEIHGVTSHAVFCSVAAVFGTITVAGADHSPELSLREDPARFAGTSPLVVSFWIPTWIILREPQSTVGFGLRSTTGTVSFIPLLGMDLLFFRTSLMDKTSIHVSRTRPGLSDELIKIRSASYGQSGQGAASPISVALDNRTFSLSGLSCRVEITGEKEIFTLASGSAVSSRQLSPCGVEVSFEQYTYTTFFPFPVDHSRVKLRIARKSHYVEIIVPASGPFTAGGFSVDPFPVIFEGNTPTVWNMHRLVLDHLPVLDIKKKEHLHRWMNTHVSLMLSDRERASTSGGEISRGVYGGQNPLQVLVDIKESLHALYVRYTGIQGSGQADVFALYEPSMGGGYTLIFITDLRLDSAAHTIVLDAFVLPLTHATLSRIENGLPALHREGLAQIATVGDEMRAWKHLLPAFVERARQTWIHAPDCAYVAAGKVPLSTDMEKNPICACGEGRDTASFRGIKAWAPFAPFVTRAAISPLFAASYLETVAGMIPDILKDLKAGRTGTLTRSHGVPIVESASIEACAVCGGGRTPCLLKCSRCKLVSYCSAECQKADWKSHKNLCRREH